MKSSFQPRTAYQAPSRLRSFQLLLFSAIAAWLILTMISAAATQNMLFDGAMNLEVAISLVNGEGPFRLYGVYGYDGDARTPFLHGVQTKEPYILVAAAVFKLFGIGPFQAQLPNLIYLAALCVLVFHVTRRYTGTFAASVATLAVLSTPMLAQYGLNGYGELPTLFFGLAGIAIICHPAPIDRRLLLRSTLAGLLCGLAVATKVVGVSLAAAAAFTLLVRILVESNARIRTLPTAMLGFGGGLLAPLLLVELWRWAAMGTAEYRHWGNDEIKRILFQAGVSPTDGVHTPLMEKILAHFTVLASETGRTRLAATLLLIAPLVSAALMFALDSKFRRIPGLRWWLLALATVSALFMVWWLAITPTEKAWLRRVYIGLVCLSLIGSIALASALSAIVSTRHPGKRVVFASVFLMLCTVYIPFLLRALQAPISFQRSEPLSRSLAAAEVVRRIPRDALVFAYGWYAAPTVAVYSGGRRFIDLTDWPVGMHDDHDTYLVADRASFVTGAANRTLGRYPHRMLLDENSTAQVYQLDMANPNDPFAGRELETLSFAPLNEGDYKATYGMQPVNAAMGGRWIESDSEILLRYEGQSAFSMSAYMPLQSYMLAAKPVSGRILIEGCKDPLRFAFDKSSWQTFQFPLDQCRPAPGSNLRVRLLLDNTMHLPRVYNTQQAMLLGKIGFV